jgi:hypothetical protein
MSSASDWASTKTPEGKVYYYNRKTKATQWTAPEGFSDVPATATPAATPASANGASGAVTAASASGVVTPAAGAGAALATSAVGASPWREYRSPEGKPYYHNKATGATVWTIPPEHAAALAAHEPKPVGASAATAVPAATATATATTTATSTTTSTVVAATTATTNVAATSAAAAPVSVSSSSAAATSNGVTSRSANASDAAAVPASHAPSSAASSMLGRIAADAPAPASPAEEFKKLLNDCGVMSHWDWDRALRAVVADARYSVINSLAEKKRIFIDYVVEQRERERRDLVAKKLRLRDAFVALLSSHKLIDAQTEWRQAAIVLADEPAFLGIVDPDERQFFFEEFQSDKQKAVRDKEQAARDALIDAAAQVVVDLAYTDAGLTPPPASGGEASGGGGARSRRSRRRFAKCCRASPSWPSRAAPTCWPA